MDLARDDPRTRKFVTNVGLITTKGPHGENIMAAEWTHHVSYAPSLIAVSIHKGITNDNIAKSKAFGANLCASDQNVVSSVAGTTKGDEVDKIAVLKELGVEFSRGKKIDVPMVKGAAMNAECRVIKEVELGTYTLFIGEVVELSATGKQPLIYHDGKYWTFGDQIVKPGKDVLDRIEKSIEKHRKK